jgi:hypothetical protein
MNKRILLIIVSCLLVGFAAGMVVTQVATKKRIKSMVEMHRPPKFMHLLKKELKLTDQQEKEFERIAELHLDRVSDIRIRERKNMRAEMDSIFSKLDQELDENQKLRLEKLIRRRHQRRGEKGWRKRRKE